MTEPEEAKDKPVFRLGNPRSLESMVAFVEPMTGEKMTPEEVEELRQALDLPTS
jgi:hypothetical protein